MSNLQVPEGRVYIPLVFVEFYNKDEWWMDWRETEYLHKLKIRNKTRTEDGRIDHTILKEFTEPMLGIFLKSQKAYLFTKARGWTICMHLKDEWWYVSNATVARYAKKQHKILNLFSHQQIKD